MFVQVLAVENVNFGAHVENQTGVRDGLSRKHHRVYQLYSRTSGKHVQVLGKKSLPWEKMGINMVRNNLNVSAYLYTLIND